MNEYNTYPFTKPGMNTKAFLPMAKYPTPKNTTANKTFTGRSWNRRWSSLG